MNFRRNPRPKTVKPDGRPLHERSFVQPNQTIFDRGDLCIVTVVAKDTAVLDKDNYKIVEVTPLIVAQTGEELTLTTVDEATTIKNEDLTGWNYIRQFLVSTWHYSTLPSNLFPYKIKGNETYTVNWSDKPALTASY